jgi:putative SOS response-associated peptidase YedK
MRGLLLARVQFNSGGVLMCGRYVSPDEAAIEREFNLLHTEWQFPPSFNVAPTQEVPIVRIRDGRRQDGRLRWGLIP